MGVEYAWRSERGIAAIGTSGEPRSRDEVIAWAAGKTDHVVAIVPLATFDGLVAELVAARAAIEASREVASNEAEDIDSRLRYVHVQPDRDEWAGLLQALDAYGETVCGLSTDRFEAG